jgi:hypothetical protein
MQNREGKHAKYKHGRYSKELYELVSVRDNDIYRYGNKRCIKRAFGLSDRKKIKGRVDVDKLKALINEGLSFSEVARRMGFERMTLKGFCEREGISTKRGK